MQLIEMAESRCEPNEDGSYVKADVHAELRNLLSVDVEKAKDDKANRLLKKAEEEGSTYSTGMIQLPGLELPYEPSRRMSDAEGNFYKEEKAPLHAFQDELHRKEDNLKNVTKKYQEHAAKTVHLATWTMEQQEKGRPPVERVWGNCVKETGILVVKKATPEEDDEAA